MVDGPRDKTMNEETDRCELKIGMHEYIIVDIDAALGHVHRSS